MEPKKSERNWKENRESPVSSGSGFLTSQFLPQPSAPTFLGGGVPGTVLGSASSSSSEEGARSWEGWETCGREVEGCAREPTVVSMAIM